VKPARVRIALQLLEVGQAVPVGIATGAVVAAAIGRVETVLRFPRVGQAVAVGVENRRVPAEPDHFEVVGVQRAKPGKDEVHVPPRVVRAGDVHVGSVIRDDEAVGLHGLEDATQRRREARQVDAGLQPQPRAHRESARGIARAM
jgi:hypothetical protein